jgi:hypothetical protein
LNQEEAEVAAEAPQEVEVDSVTEEEVEAVAEEVVEVDMTEDLHHKLSQLPLIPPLSKD